MSDRKKGIVDRVDHRDVLSVGPCTTRIGRRVRRLLLVLEIARFGVCLQIGIELPSPFAVDVVLLGVGLDLAIFLVFPSAECAARRRRSNSGGRGYTVIGHAVLSGAVSRQALESPEGAARELRANVAKDASA